MVLSATDDVVLVQPENVPEVLKQADRWCVWRREPTKEGKLTKKPLQAAKPAIGLSKTTPSQWRPFNTALKAYESHSNVDGLGFVTGGGFVALDFDECADDVTRELKPDVAEVVRKLNSYAEYSPSGRGVRVFVRGELPGENVTSKAAGYELYAEGAYVTVTGAQLVGTPLVVADGGELLAELYAKAKQAQADDKERRQAEKKAKKAASPEMAAIGSDRKAVQSPSRLPIPSAGRTDDEVLELVRRSAGGAQFDKLWSGQWEGDYPTQSEAELGLANYLAFYAGSGSESQVEQLMRQSGLNRDKFNEPRGSAGTYLSLTVGTAYEGRTDFYSGGKTATGKKAVELVLPNGMASTGPACLSDFSTLTDIGLARRLVLESRGTLRYCREQRTWLAFNGRHWQHDDGLAAAHTAKQVADKLWRELAELPGNQRLPAVVAFVKAASSGRSIEAAVKLARSEPGVVVTVAELDTNPYLLNCKNGTLDLLTLTLKPHSPADLLTHLANVDYEATANAPTFRKFVDDVAGGDKELVHFLQRSCGLALSGDVSEQVLWLHYGEGRNGKSTLLSVMSELLGTYAGPAPLDMLLVKNKNKEVETQFASLAGKRLVTAVEADSGVRFSEAATKLLTGGDTVQARRLYENPWSLKPTWKLHVAANHKPVVRGTDEGIWRRLMLTPWLQRFDGQREDKKLKEKLLAELPGVLAWCVAGFNRWQADGLKPPAGVLAATSEYRAENDVLGTWLAECCLVDAHAVAEAGALYRSFKAWCEDRGEHAKTATAFGMELERLGYANERPSSGQWRHRTIRRGIGLLDVRRENDAA
jgi:putative DNA primase/helicase